MNCEIVQEEFSSFIDNELSVEGKNKMSAHLETCSQCETLFKNLKETLHVMHSLPSLKTSDDFVAKLLTTAHSNQNKRSSFSFLNNDIFKYSGYGIAAGLVLALGFTQLMVPKIERPNITAHNKIHSEVPLVAEMSDSLENTLNDTALNNQLSTQSSQELLLVNQK